jgi:carnitine O-palmitoyltransferase 2
MLRRSLPTFGPTTKSGVDISNWSRLTDKLAKATTGTCFDPAVLEPTIIPTNHLQTSLFRLPIPKLEQTCKSYLDTVQPLVTPAAFEKTKANVADFLKPENGGRLNTELIEIDKKSRTFRPTGSTCT